MPKNDRQRREGPENIVAPVSRRLAYIGAMLMASNSLAQDASKTVPQTGHDLSVGPTTLPTTPNPNAESTADTALVVEKLQGLVLSNELDELKILPSAPGLTLKLKSLKNTSGLEKELSKSLGAALTFDRLNKICASIVRIYGEAGFPVVDAIVPEQDVTSGVVKILVLEGKLGEVRIEGGDKPRNLARLKKQIRIKHGETIESKALLNDLSWLNRQNPTRQVDLLFERSKEKGSTDVILNVQQAPYNRAYVGYENTGTDSTGADRFMAGITLTDLFRLGKDWQLGYQFTSSDDFSRFQAHGLNFVMPLSWRHIFSTFGTWSRTQPDFADARLASDGESWQVSARYEIPLSRHDKPLERLRDSIEFGIDFKRSNNNLEFGGQKVFERSADTVQFIADYQFQYAQATVATNGKIGVVLSPGSITPGNSDENYNIARPGATSDYFYTTFEITRQRQLPRGFTWTNRLEAQWGPSELLSGEQIGIGGAKSVRGYNEHALNGDSGIFFSSEIDTPGLHLLPRAINARANDDLRLHLFLDAGSVWNSNPSTGNPSHGYAISAGPGLEYRIGSCFDLALDYGFHLADNADDTDSGRYHLRIVGTISW